MLCSNSATVSSNGRLLNPVIVRASPMTIELALWELSGLWMVQTSSWTTSQVENTKESKSLTERRDMPSIYVQSAIRAHLYLHFDGFLKCRS